MHGVYYLYASPAPAQSPSTAAHPSASPAHVAPSPSPRPPEPAVVVLTPPHHHDLAAGTGDISDDRLATPRGTPPIDVNLLQLVYAAHPTAFVVVVNEPPVVDAPGSSGASTPLPHAAVHAFFQQPAVQQRTCRLTLASAASSSSPSSPSSPSEGRHVLHLSPMAAAHVMQRQPWLKELHECARRLCTVTEVAAAVLLAGTGVLAAPSAPCAFRVSTATVLEMVAQCEWVGDAELAALLLGCVARAASGARGGATAPRMPKWVRGRDAATPHDLSDAPDEDETAREDGLRVLEAYSTHTTSGAAAAAAALPASASALPPALTTPGASLNVTGGCVGLASNTDARRAADSPEQRLGHSTDLQNGQAREAATAATSVTVDMHVLVCTALAGGDGDGAARAAAAVTAGAVITALLRRLQRKSHRQQRGRCRDSGGVEVEYTAHLSLNGHDALRPGRSRSSSSSSSSNAVPAEQPAAALAAGSLKDALAQLSPELLTTTTCTQSSASAEVEGGDGGAEDGLVARVLAQVRATLRQLRDVAHAERLAAAVSGVAAGPPPRPPRDPLLPCITTARRPAPSTSAAAVVLCVDDHCLGHWAERGYPTLAARQASAPPMSLSPLLHDTPLYLCVLPSTPVSSSATTAATVQRQLCQTPWILEGLRTAYTLCTRTHGTLFVHAGAADAVPQARTDAVTRHMANRLHGWAAAVFRNVHLCVFSELRHSYHDGGEGARQRRSRSAGSATVAAQHLDVPQCAVCAPGLAAQRWSPDVHVRLWRCAAATCLAARRPTAPFLLYEVLATAASRSHGHAQRQRQQEQQAQAWAEEFVSQHVFAFARCAQSGSGSSSEPTRWAVSPVARVQLRISLFKPGPLLLWYRRQYTLHATLSALAVVLEAQVERVKSLFFVLAATEGGRLERQGLSSAEARAALAEAVLDALRRITVSLARRQRHDTAVVATLAHLLPFESLDEHLPTSSSTAGSASASAAAAPATAASPVLPAAVRGVVDEVDAARRRLRHERQQQRYVLGEPMAPSVADTAAAVARLVQLLLLQARVHHVHAAYAAVVDGDSAETEEEDEHAEDERTPAVQASGAPAEVTGRGSVLQATPSETAESRLHDFQRSGEPAVVRLRGAGRTTEAEDGQDAAMMPLAAEDSQEDAVVDVDVPPLPLSQLRVEAVHPATKADPLSGVAPAQDVAGTAAGSRDDLEVRLGTSAREAPERLSVASLTEQLAMHPHPALEVAASAPVVALPEEATVDVVEEVPDQEEDELSKYVRARPSPHVQHALLDVSADRDEAWESPVFDVRLPPAPAAFDVDGAVRRCGDEFMMPHAALDVHTAPVAASVARDSPEFDVQLREPAAFSAGAAAAAVEPAFNTDVTAAAAGLPLAVHVDAPSSPPTHSDVALHGGGPATEQRKTPTEVELTEEQVHGFDVGTPPPPQQQQQWEEESTTPTRPLTPPLTPDASRESSVDAARPGDRDAGEEAQPLRRDADTVATPRSTSPPPPPEHPYNCRRTSSASASAEAATAAAYDDGSDPDAVRARARLPTPPPPPRVGVGRGTPASALGTNAAAPAAVRAAKPAQPTPPPLPLRPSTPPLQRDLRWSTFAPPSTTDTRGATTAADAVSSVAALLATHLPAPASATAPACVLPSSSGLLRVARYGAGLLTMDAYDPTCAAQAALLHAGAPLTARPQQPVACLALLHVDTTTRGGALRLLEVLPCGIAPTLAAAPCEAAAQTAVPRSRYTFLSTVPPSTAVAVVYLGLRRPATQWVSATDVLWMSGVAFAVERPALESASASDVRADGVTVHWTPAAARVQVVVARLAAPPKMHARRTPPAGGADEQDGAEAGRSAVQVRLRSPTVITGLRAGSVYLLELTPLPSGRRTVTLRRPSPASPPPPYTQQEVRVQLDAIVDANVAPRAVVAATSLVPSLRHLRVQELRAAPASTVLCTGADSRSATATAALPYPHVAGRVVCPLFHYATAAFPLALLRHSALFPTADADETAVGGSAALRGAQLVRLHLTTVPVLTADPVTDALAGKVHVDTAADARQPSPPPVVQLTALEDALALPDASGHAGLRRYAFVVPAGVDVGVSLSVRVHLSAERVLTSAPTASAAAAGAAPATTYVPIFHDVQRNVLSALLGPFHVCLPAQVRTHADVDADEVELVWCGTAANYDVRVCRRNGAVACTTDGAEAAVPATGATFSAESDFAGGPAKPSKSTAVAADTPSDLVRTQSPRGSAEAVHRVAGALLSDAEANASEHAVDRTNTAAGGRAGETTAVRGTDSTNERALPLYRGLLRLGGLQAAAEYVAHVTCTENHVGAAVQAVWRTRPAAPLNGRCHAVFDSAARQLHLRFSLDSPRAPTPPQEQQRPCLYYEALVHPLNTLVQVPAEGPAVVRRVLDCSLVPRGAPIAVELRRRVVWSPESAEGDSGNLAAAPSLVSDAVMYCVVSELHVCLVRSQQQQEQQQHPALELRWTCAGSGVVPGLGDAAVAAVVLNGVCRMPVAATAGPQHRVALPLAQLRAAAATTNTAVVGREPSATHAQSPREREAAAWWKGVVAITDFEAASPRAVPVLDRCRTLLLPPPPPPPLSALRLHNYEDEAHVFVDVAAVYALYHDEYLRLDSVPQALRDGESVAGMGAAQDEAATTPRAPLASALRQRVQLSLEVRGTGAAAPATAAAVSLHLLDRPTAPASGGGGTAVQCIRLPLPAYRPYDAQLRLALHVRCDAVTAEATADETAARALHLLVPQPSSPGSVDLPVPPAEPILGVVVSAITACEAVVDWTPPLSLLRHLRRQPDTAVSYEVRLHPAHRTAHAANAPAPPPLRSAAVVCVTHEPHVRLTGLASATPYVVVVRGTGFGDYYAAAGFITAPVVDDAVVARVRESLTVESVAVATAHAPAVAVTVPSAMPRRPRRPAAPPAPPRRTPALWAVLPASEVVRWTPDPAAAAAPDVTVVTHYTAALVAPTGELLRQWTSAPETTTTLYDEWDAVEWPHLEVMAHTDVAVVHAEESAAATGVNSVAYAVANARESGARHRTRVDLVGTPHLGHPRRSHGPEPAAAAAAASSACTVRWGGSSDAGYDVSWCLSHDPRHVRHTHIPATAPFSTFTVPLASLGSGAAAGSSSTAAAAGPVCAFVCITSRRRLLDSAAHPRHLHRGSPDCAGGRGVRDGGSNVVCAAWLLPPPLPQWPPSPAPVVYRTAALATLLLPPSVGGEAGGAPGDGGGSEKSGGRVVVPDVKHDLLSRRYTLVADTRSDCATPDGEVGRVERDDDASDDGQGDVAARASVTVWTAAQCRTVSLDAARDGVLVEVRTPADGAAVEVELRCVDTVLQPHAPAWQQQLSAQLAQQHTTHFASDVGSSSSAVVPLRWLRVVAEARRQQCIPAVCALSHLRIDALDDAGCVEVPPLAASLLAQIARPSPPQRRRNSSGGSTDAGSRGRRAARGRGGRRAAQSSRGTHAVGAAAVSAPEGAAWLPLTSASVTAPPAPTRTDPSAQPPSAPRLLARFTGTLNDGGSVDDATDAAAAAATLAELDRLKRWTERGHPTMRVRLTWTSSDDTFVVRVAGPYEGVADVDTKGVVAGAEGQTRRAGASPAPVSPPAPSRVVRAALCRDDFPSVAAMPHQRTYTCRPVTSYEERHGDDAAAVRDALVLEPDGTVHPASAATQNGAAAMAATRGHQEDGEATAQTCETYALEVDGLVPEALYRVQVTGARSGDARLRLQFLTPPSPLTQLLTVSESATGADTAEVEAPCHSAGPATRPSRPASPAAPRLSPRQRLRVHVRHYSPHWYGLHNSQASPGGGGSQEKACAAVGVLAPGLRYSTRSYLELHNAVTGKRLVRRLMHTCGNASADSTSAAAAADGGQAASDLDGASRAIAEASFTADVEDAVRVVAVHEMEVFCAGEPGGPGAASFLNSARWGPLLYRRVADDDGNSGSGSATQRQLQHHASLFAPLRVGGVRPPEEPSESGPCAEAAQPQRVRVLLCEVPRLPRLERLAVRRCAPQSLQLTWRWWPGSAHSGNSSNSSGGGVGLEEGNARTMLLIQCSSTGHRDAAPPPPVSTAVTAVCASPLVTLSGLQPSTLYEIEISEVAMEQVATVRTLATRRRSVAAADAKAEPANAGRAHDFYAIQLSRLPASTAAALRALARNSSRPASLVLAQPRQETWMGGIRGSRGGASRGAVTCYALTPPAAFLVSRAGVPRPPTAQRVRRRPGALTVAVPCVDATALTAHASHVHREAGLLQLFYAAVLVLPERVCYVPAGAEQEVRRWWVSSSASAANSAAAAASPPLARGAAVDGGDAGVLQWWAARLEATLQQGWWHTLASSGTPTSTAASAVAAAAAAAAGDGGGRDGVAEPPMPTSFTAGGAAGAPLEVLHWSAELARRVLGVSTPHGAPPSRLRVAPVEVRRVRDTTKPGSTAASGCWWHYTIPITEPPYDSPSPDVSRSDDTPAGEAEGAAAATSTTVSRVAYVVQVEEVLPLPAPTALRLPGVVPPASVAGGALVGPAQHLTVDQAPLSVKRLRLVRDLRVRGTVTVTDTAPSANPHGTPAVSASLRVQWTWPLWSYRSTTAHAAESAAAPPHGPPSSAASRCAARVSCVPLPALDAATAAVEAVFVRHVDSGAHAVDVTGLAPATLYRLRLTDVHVLDDGGDCGADAGPRRAVRGEDVGVIALTPPAPLAAPELPVLRYHLLGPKAAATATAAAAAADPATTTHSRATPLGLEVHFQLPVAQRQSQGLLVVPHAVLVNLDAIDVDVCQTAEDLLVAAQHERVAPHLLSSLHAHASPPGAHATASPETTTAGAALSAEPPVVYRNTSTQQRLRVTVTLRRPAQQRYAVAFFCAVRPRAGPDVVATASCGAAAHDGAADGGPATAAETLYSAPTIVPMRYPASVLAVYGCGASSAAATPRHRRCRSASPSSSSRRVLCRPTRLHVHDRTGNRLVLRWALDLPALRLSEAERARLLRRGVFVVHVIADAAETSEAACHATGAVGVVEHASPAERRVFYRCNTAAASPPRATPSLPMHRVEAAERNGAAAMTRAPAFTPRHVRVGDYRVLSETGDEDAGGATRRADAQTEAAAVVTHPTCLTYEVVLPCATYTASHAAYTATVALSPDWAVDAEDEKAEAPLADHEKVGVPAADVAHAPSAERRSSSSSRHPQRRREGEPTPTASSPRPSPELTSQSILVPAVHPPLPVQRVYVVQCSRTACTVEWRVADGERRRPHAYTVEWEAQQASCGDSDGDGDIGAAVSGQQWVKAGPQVPNRSTIENLAPHTTYTIRVVPHNVYGESCESDSNAAVTVRTR